MAHSLSARKRHRQSIRRQERNRGRRTAARTAVAAAREAIASGNAAEAAAAVRTAGSILDRTANKGVIHANNASRRKHRLMRQLNALSAGEAPVAPKRKAAASKARKPASRGRSKKS